MQCSSTRSRPLPLSARRPLTRCSCSMPMKKDASPIAVGMSATDQGQCEKVCAGTSLRQRDSRWTRRPSPVTTLDRRSRGLGAKDLQHHCG
eukprot:3250132-Rhodomonas_salina.2